MEQKERNKVAAVVPAYNEEENIERVLEVLKKSQDIDEVIVVDDGSKDSTAEIAKNAGVTVIVQKNAGKGVAMMTGVKAADATIIFFADADLLGLTETHLHELISPVSKGEVEMTVGLRDRGRFLTWILPKIAPVLGGERAMTKKMFLSLPGKSIKDFGIETIMNAYCQKHKLGVKYIATKGLTQVIKEQKYGLWTGFKARIRMAEQILRAEQEVWRIKW